MYLTYLGESGNTGNSLNDPNQPHHVHVGLLVHESQSISMNGEFDALYRRHFDRTPDEPGGPKGIRAGEVYQGIGVFSSWPVAKRHQLIKDCFDILLRRQTPVIVAYIDKQDFAQARASGDNPSAVWQSPSEPVISRFLAALNLFMDELNIAGVDAQELMTVEFQIKDFALVVAGDNRSVEPRFMTQFLRSDEGFDASALLENFCFVNTEDAVGYSAGKYVRLFHPEMAPKPIQRPPIFRCSTRRQRRSSNLPGPGVEPLQARPSCLRLSHQCSKRSNSYAYLGRFLL